MDNCDRGLVTVIVPTYRRSVYLERAIRSICAQTYNNLEIIVVNDNIPGDEYSLDLYQLMKKFSDDSRVRIIEQEKHINGAAARNAGIRDSHGEYISFLDDDDYWEPEKIQLQIEAFSGLSEDYGMVGCMVRTYKDGKLIRASCPFKDGNILYDVMNRVTALGTGSVLIKRSVLDDVGYFDEGLKRHQDLQLFAIICQKYKVKLVKRYLYNVDISDNANRPQTPEQVVDIKKSFFSSISNVIDSMPKHQQKIIHLSHKYELVPVYLKARNRKKALKIIIKLIMCPSALIMAVKRTYIRLFSNKCRNYLEKKYL